MKTTIFRAFVITSAMLWASCASAFGSEFYEVGSNEAIYLAWTQDNSGHLQGQVHIVSIDPANNTQLKTTTAQFTGTRSGSEVSLTFNSLFGGTTWTGHVSGGRLTLVIPTSGIPQQVTLYAGSFDQFQGAVARMQRTVGVNQYNVALLSRTREAADHLKSDTDSITGGLRRLHELFGSSGDAVTLRRDYATEWQKLSSAWDEEQKEATVTPMTCYQKSQVLYQSSQVDYELAQFNYWDSQLGYFNRQYNSATGDVQSGINDLQVWTVEFNSRARAYLASIGKGYNGNAVTAAAPTISGARRSLESFAQQFASLRTYTKTYDGQAKKLDSKAKAFANAINCTD